MPQSKKVPFWRSLQTKFAMTYILIVAAVLILLNIKKLKKIHPIVYILCGAVLGILIF